MSLKIDNDGMEQCLRKLFVNGTTLYMKLKLFVFKFTYMNKKIGKKISHLDTIFHPQESSLSS